MSEPQKPIPPVMKPDLEYNWIHRFVGLYVRTIVVSAKFFPFPYAPFLAKYSGRSVPKMYALLAIAEAIQTLQFLVAPLSERYGAKSTTTFASILSIIGCTLLAIPQISNSASASVVADGFTVLAFVLIGLGFFMFANSYYAGMQFLVDGSRIGREIAFVELGFVVSRFVTFPLLGWGLERVGFELPWAALTGAGVISVILQVVFLPNTNEKTRFKQIKDGPQLSLYQVALNSYRTIFTSAKAVITLVYTLAFFIAFSILMAGYVLWLKDIHAVLNKDMGAVETAAGLGTLLGDIIMITLADKFGLLKSIGIGTAVCLATNLIWLTTGHLSYPMGLACVVLFFTSHVFVVTCLFAYVASMLKHVSSSSSGLLGAISALCYCIGYFASEKIHTWAKLHGLIAIASGTMCLALLVWPFILKYETQNKPKVDNSKNTPKVDHAGKTPNGGAHEAGVAMTVVSAV